MGTSNVVQGLQMHQHIMRCDMPDCYSRRVLSSHVTSCSSILRCCCKTNNLGMNMSWVTRHDSQYELLSGAYTTYGVTCSRMKMQHSAQVRSHRSIAEKDAVRVQLHDLLGWVV